MKKFKFNNPIVEIFYIIKIFFECFVDLIYPSYTYNLFGEALKRNKGTLYYSVVKYINNTELIQYCNFYLPLENSKSLCNVNDLLDDYCNIKHDFVTGKGKLNCCVIMKDLDFMYLQSAIDKKYGKSVTITRISEDDSRI